MWRQWQPVTGVWRSSRSTLFHPLFKIYPSTVHRWRAYLEGMLVPQNMPFNPASTSFTSDNPSENPFTSQNPPPQHSLIYTLKRSPSTKIGPSKNPTYTSFTCIITHPQKSNPSKYAIWHSQIHSSQTQNFKPLIKCPQKYKFKFLTASPLSFSDISGLSPFLKNFFNALATFTFILHSAGYKRECHSSFLIQALFI